MTFRYTRALYYFVAAAAISRAQSLAPVGVQLQVPQGNVPHLNVTNLTSKIVTAVAVVGAAVPLPSGNGRVTMRAIRFYDAATEPQVMKPLLANQSLTVDAPIPGIGAGTGLSVTAVIFADGTSWGDQATVGRMTRRRGYMEKYLASAIPELVSALSAQTAEAQLVAQLQSEIATESALAADADERACLLSVRGLVLANLKQSALPVSDVLGHGIPLLYARLVALQVYAPQAGGGNGAQ